MKKFYILLVASALALSANAQQLQKVEGPVMTYNPSAMTLAPKKAQTVVEGTVAWGYYDGSAIQSNKNISLVGYGQAGTYNVAVKVPANSLLKGAQVKAFDMPIYDPAVFTGDVEVAILDGTTVLSSEKVAASSLTQLSLNTVEFSTPVTIEKDLLICMTYTTSGTSQQAKYPILYDTSVTVAGSLLLPNDSNGFDDYGTQFGALACQVQVAGIAMEDANVAFIPAVEYTTVNSDVNVEFTLESNSGKAVNSIEYTISVNGGEAETRTANVSFEPGFNKSAALNIAFHTPDVIGAYPVVLTLTKVNGDVPNAQADKPVTYTFHNLSHIVERNVVMEEFTGTGCGFCPRGWAGMLECNEKYGDRFIGIALHQYNSTDPMYIASSNYPLSYGGAPSSYIDRDGGEVDPGFDSADAAIQKRLKVVAPVGVNVTATWADADRKTVNVTAEVDGIASGTYELVYVLTADGLTGTSFKQSNYYYSYAMANDGSLLDKFCNGGEYGKSSVQLVYDDVALATSYASSKNKGGKITLGTDEKATSEYTLTMPTNTMPTKAALVTAIKNSDYNVYAVVIALNADGTVANAGKVKVTFAEGIESVVSEEAVPVAYYTLDGRRVNSATPGVNIIRMSDGTSKTVILK